ncbi:Hypp8693 [Branchiostoma lanceolatum]|uniref:Hypp8693 protein n=1 Tax=Branchiostoma lanceolatum TaxID=7740 RepID=A0A8J9Z9H1_BRALA|nr:Hypp8693 [Branchiostoma lanceolatum]
MGAGGAKLRPDPSVLLLHVPHLSHLSHLVSPVTPVHLKNREERLECNLIHQWAELTPLKILAETWRYLCPPVDLTCVGVVPPSGVQLTFEPEPPAVSRGQHPAPSHNRTQWDRRMSDCLKTQR